MIALVISERCIACRTCVEVCPTNVFDADPSGAPVIARQDDCQTCFLCELYCPADALYVHPQFDPPGPVAEADVLASGMLGRFRRDSGWGEWEDDPRYENQHWRMGEIFARARASENAKPPK